MSNSKLSISYLNNIAKVDEEERLKQMKKVPANGKVSTNPLNKTLICYPYFIFFYSIAHR